MQSDCIEMDRKRTTDHPNGWARDVMKENVTACILKKCQIKVQCDTGFRFRFRPPG